MLLKMNVKQFRQSYSEGGFLVNSSGCYATQTTLRRAGGVNPWVYFMGKFVSILYCKVTRAITGPARLWSLSPQSSRWPLKYQDQHSLAGDSDIHEGALADARSPSKHRRLASCRLRYPTKMNKRVAGAQRRF